jgi:hypothetical protein
MLAAEDVALPRRATLEELDGGDQDIERVGRPSRARTVSVATG